MGKIIIFLILAINIVIFFEHVKGFLKKFIKIFNSKQKITNKHLSCCNKTH